MTKATLHKKIGERIKALRKKRGLSQSELARLTGKDRQSIFKVENGEFNATVFYLYEIAKVLQVTLSELVDFE